MVGELGTFGYTEHQIAEMSVRFGITVLRSARRREARQQEELAAMVAGMFGG